MWGQRAMVGPVRSLGMKAHGLVLLFVVSFVLAGGCITKVDHGRGTVIIAGEMKQWHDIVLTFDGPQAEEAGEPNPFLDYRLDVTFVQGQKQYVVPGYYAADGTAGQTGATAGNKWRVHFLPPEPGVWTYTVSLRTGTDVAIDGSDGVPVAPADGMTGTIAVGPTDKTGRDFRRPGTAAVHRPAVPAVRPHRDVLHQRRGRQPGELPGLCGLRRDLRHRGARRARARLPARSSSISISRTSGTGGPAIPPGRAARARASSAP